MVGKIIDNVEICLHVHSNTYLVDKFNPDKILWDCRLYLFNNRLGIDGAY